MLLVDLSRRDNAPLAEPKVVVLDGGRGLVIFRGKHPTLELPTAASIDSDYFPAGFRNSPSGVSYSEPGCYAYQIDGETFPFHLLVQVEP